MINLGTNYIISSDTSKNAIAPNSYIRNNTGQYILIMQTDGNLVGYDTSTPGGYTPFWASGTANTVGYMLVLGTNGVSTVIDRNWNTIWNTHDFAQLGPGQSCTLIMQKDRNIVIYDSNNSPLWSSSMNV